LSLHKESTKGKAFHIDHDMQEPGHKAEYMGCMCSVYVMDDSKKRAITHGSLGTV